MRFTNEQGKTVEIVFRGGIHVDSTAKYSTTNEEIQKFLESRGGFNRDYYISEASGDGDAVPEVKTAPAPKTEEKKLTDVKDIRRFHNIVEMKNYMAEIGLEVTPEMNYAQAKSLAAKEGYDFQVQRYQK